MTSKKNAAQVAAQAEPCPDFKSGQAVDLHAVFGERFPEDVIAPIRVAQERLIWLEQLFDAIADSPGIGFRAKYLAEMGRFVASEASDLADCCHADMLEAIKKGGAA